MIKSLSLEQVVRGMEGQGTQLSKMYRDLLYEINAIRELGGESEQAADLILAACPSSGSSRPGN